MPLLCAAALTGCASLPSNGPTVGQLQRTIQHGDAGITAELVPIDARTIATADDMPADTGGSFAALPNDGGAYAPETVWPGDVLSVTVYEVGISLFGSQSTSSAQTGMPTAGAQTVPSIRVDEKGVIDLPYVGTLAVAGLTPLDVGRAIEERLRGLSQSPQAVVGIVESSAGSVSLMGAIARSGLYRSTVTRQHLRDLIASAGGPTADPQDIVVRLVRQGHTLEMRLSDMGVGSPNDIYAMPGDRLELLHRPRTYTAFGASDRVGQVPFNADQVSLLEAVARAGGPSDPRANPKGVYLFRWMPVPGAADRPVIYRLDMMQAGSYLVANRFMVRDKDVLYFANSASSPPTKFIAILNQLFSPVLTITALVR